MRFGTDGIRGSANDELTPELALALGRAAARVLVSAGRGRSRFLVGRDTRWSGPLLQAALSAGLASEGVDVVDLGVVPTPAVAYLAADEGAAAAVISASHNPYEDNGIKFFLPGWLKLPDRTEEMLEAELELILGAGPGARAGSGRRGSDVGCFSSGPDALRRYEERLVSCLEGRDLAGLRVVLDCANGAAHRSAPDVFRAAGAELAAVLGRGPDGTNINRRCGSTDPAALVEAVRANRAELGLAFDGDADRVIAVSADGQVVDGDRILALFAADMHERGVLAGGTVVVTVMTNLGFHRAMEDLGVKVHTVGVGDRYVLEALDANGWCLGGEQSGHIVFRSLATTGDGVLSGLLLADLARRRGAPLHELAASAMQRFPQVLRNVRVARRDALGSAEQVWEAVARAEAELGADGRVVLRPSGTEPLVRVMVEARSEAHAGAMAELLVAALHGALGGPGQG